MSGRPTFISGTRLIFSQLSFTVAGPSICNFYPFMSAIPTLGLSFALSSRLTSLALPMYDSKDYPASICTFELCKKGTINLQLHCIALLAPIVSVPVLCRPSM